MFSSKQMMNQELFVAVELDDIETVTRLIARGADANTRGGIHNLTVLFEAFYNKNKEMVELLLESGSDVNETDNKFGMTVLMLAAETGNVKMVDLLIKHHADVLKKNTLGTTAIHRAASRNHVTIVEKLLSFGVSVDIGDKRGYTPLCYAADSGDVSFVDLLLKRGANPHHKCQNGSPLDIAKRNGCIRVAEMIEDAIRSKSASEEGHVGVVKQREEMICRLQRENENLREQLRQSERARRKDVVKPTNEGNMEVLMSALATARSAAAKLHHSNGSTASQASGSAANQPQEGVSQVVRDVQRTSSARWYVIGRDCGQSSDELQELRQLTNDADKIQYLFDMMTLKLGEKEAADKLLRACNVIEPPGYEAVKKEMRGGSK